MSSDLPEFSPATQQWESSRRFAGGAPPGQREWLISLSLLILTVFTTTFAGLFYLSGNLEFGRAIALVLLRPGLLLRGLPFSIPLIVILLAHEMGHYLACRYYGMHCTPPYFIPAPILITGTLGAFIKIKSRFFNRNALFDVGIAGPLAGFLFVLPTLWIGISFSKLIPKGALGPGLSFGEPIIFRLFGMLILGYSPAKQDMIPHPIAMAAWVGLLATSLNLLPIWQLDGGHIAYAIFGRSRQKKMSIAALVALILVSFAGWPTPSYLLFSVLLLIIGIRSRFYHPPVLLDDQRLGTGRVFLGLIAFLILIISFMPVPISFV